MHAGISDDLEIRINLDVDESGMWKQYYYGIIMCCTGLFRYNSYTINVIHHHT